MTQIAVHTVYNASGQPRVSAHNVAPKASDFRISRPRTKTPDVPRRAYIGAPEVASGRRRKALEASPRAYLTLIAAMVKIGRRFKVTVDEIEVEGVPIIVFNVATSRGCAGNAHVDSWTITKPEQPRPGFLALASASTPWNIWVQTEGDFEWNVAAAIARSMGVKHPKRFI